jgi:hypothetical protein
MGGTCSSIRISLPIEEKIEIAKVEIIKTESLIPSAKFQIYYGDRPGQMRLGSKINNQILEYNASQIKNSRNIVIKATQVAICNNGSIDTKNVEKEFVFEKLIPAVCGQLVLHRENFPPEPAIYKASLKALDSNLNEVGCPGDDFFIRTDY